MLLYTVVRNILGYVQLVFTQNTGSSEIRFKVSMYIYIYMYIENGATCPVCFHMCNVQNMVYGALGHPSIIRDSAMNGFGTSYENGRTKRRL